MYVCAFFSYVCGVNLCLWIQHARSLSESAFAVHQTRTYLLYVFSKTTSTAYDNVHTI